MRSINCHGVALNVIDDDVKFWDRVDRGAWERTTFEVFDREIDAGTTVLDFGAWIGPTSLYAASRARRVISFEPDPIAANHLRSNIALNPDLAAKITVIEKAVAPHSGSITMGARKKQGDSMSSMLHTDSAIQWSVPTITPGEIAAMLEPHEKVFVKIDTEGGEYVIVPALAPLARRANTSFLVSFHPKFVHAPAPRWLTTAPMSRKVFAALAGRPILEVGDAAIERRPALEALNRIRLCLMEAHGSYLFGARD